VRPDDNETVTQQDQENQLSRKLGVPSFGYSTKQLPDVGPVQIFEVRIRAGNHQAYAGAGEPFATMIQAQRGIKRSFVLAGSIALVLAVLASYLVGARVSAPLRRLAALARRVDAGDLEPRMEVRATHSVEIRVLTDALNHMLDRLADSFSAQRSFVADASHELRTPLTVMRGELELLAMTKHPSDEELRDFQRRVQAEIARVSRLVDDLLLLAQAERTDFLRVSPIELAQFIPELWDSVKLTADRDFQLGTVPDAVLLADPDRLAQAIRNLARNAIEHTSDGDGLVRLEVELGPSPSVTFRVLDDGPGIPPAERERIFERFHRSDPGRTRSAGGAGLGLAIVHAIAEAHNGTVGATESRNRGAQVELKLPTVVSVDDRTAVPSSQHALDR
jgi:signal transduction histidine kinase